MTSPDPIHVTDTPLPAPPLPVLTPSEAYAQSLDAMRALPKERLIPINVDVGAAVELGIATAWRVVPLREALVNELSSFDVTQLDHLDRYARALFHAHALYTLATPTRDALPARMERAIVLRDMMVRDAKAAVLHGRLSNQALPLLSGRIGYRNVAFDLGALGTFFVEHWHALAGTGWITTAHLTEAEQLTDDIITMLAARHRLPSRTDDPADLRLRAFTLFVQAYEEVRAVVAWYRRKQGDADAVAPSLYRGRRGKRTAKPENPKPTSPMPGRPTPEATQLPA